MHIYADASKEVIAAPVPKVVWLLSRFLHNTLSNKENPLSSGHTVPRVELCAAGLAVQLADVIYEQLKIDREDFSNYSDSQGVLGYIMNENTFMLEIK